MLPVYLILTCPLTPGGGLTTHFTPKNFQILFPFSFLHGVRLVIHSWVTGVTEKIILQGLWGQLRLCVKTCVSFQRRCLFFLKVFGSAFILILILTWSVEDVIFTRFLRPLDNYCDTCRQNFLFILSVLKLFI